MMMRRAFLSIILTVNLLALESSFAQTVPQEQIDALIQLYNITDGDNWNYNSGWKDSNGDFDVGNIGNWFGISLDPLNNVSHINLAYNNLNGDITHWTKLIDLSNGEIEIELQNNQLYGLIEDLTIDRFYAYRFYLYNNNIGGEINNWVVDNCSISFLWLNQNNIAGIIDLWEFESDYPRISNLRLDNNSIEGLIHNWDIPFKNHLSSLNLGNNKISGNFSMWDTNECPYLRDLNVGGNNIEINIESVDFSDKKRLRTLILSDNNIYGDISNFDLSPIDNLFYLTITNGNISGNIEDFNLTENSTLRELRLTNNNITGNIANWDVDNLVYLEDLILEENDISGNLDNWVINGGFENLNILSLSDNKIIGDLNSWSSFLNLEEIDYLIIDGNRFTFEGLLPFVDSNPVVYYNQAMVDAEKAITVDLYQSLTLTTTIDRNTSTPCKYQWFKDGEEVTTLDTNNHTYVVPSTSLSDAGVYNYIIENDDAPNLTLSSRDQTVIVNEVICDSIDVDYNYIIDINGVEFTSSLYNPSSCSISQYTWDFGDGNTSSEANPTHVYCDNGVFDVSLIVDYSCDDECGVRQDTITSQVSVLGEEILHLPLNGTTQDVSGNELHGVNYGASPAADRFGNINGALNFDGEDDYMAIYPAENSIAPLEDFSLSFWVHLDSYKDGPDPLHRQYIIDFNSDTNTVNSNDHHAYIKSGFAVAADFDGNNASVLNILRYQDATGADSYRHSVDLRSKWSFLTMVRENTILKFYVDGELVLSESCLDTPLDINHPLYIGTFNGNNPNYPSGYNYNFNGRIDDIKLFERALTAEEVNEDYNQDVILKFDYTMESCGVDFTSQFGGNEGCEVLSYHWDFGDGTTSDEANPNHIYTETGSYDVTLSIEYDCDNGCGVLVDSVTSRVVNIPDEVLALPFNGNPDDVSGNQNHGTVYGAELTSDRFGNLRSAYQFDGIDDYITIPHDDILDMGTGDFTLAAWIQSSENTSQMVFQKGGSQGPSSPQYWLRISDQYLTKDVAFITGDGSGGSSQVAVSNHPVNDGDWHFLVVQRQGARHTIFVDGIMLAQENLESEDTYNEEGIIIGAQHAWGSTPIHNFFKGKIDDIQLINRILTPDEIFDIYKESPSMNFTHFPHACGVNFVPEVENESDCEILTYTWDFGDGNVSNEQEPFHVYGNVDIYDVKLKIEFDCNDGCGVQSDSVIRTIDLNEDIFEQIRTIQVKAAVIDSVLSASASSFSDSWFIDYDDTDLIDAAPYLNGSKGVWRNEASYVYREDRSSSSEVDLEHDGTFTMESFNWAYAELDAIPNWLKTNTVTKYSPYSYELENRDILDNYSSALYGYGGQMPVAVGQNMKHSEMAFTGFEDLDNSGFEIISDASQKGSGNWTLSVASEGYDYHSFKVQLGYGNMAMINRPIEDFNEIDTVNIFAKWADTVSVLFFKFPIPHYKQLYHVPILCKESDGEFNEKTILTFGEVVSDDIWFGRLSHYEPSKRGEFSDISNTVAHTGRKSLRISSTKRIRQNYLDLEPQKEYLLSAWLSVNDKYLYTPVLGDNLGIRLIFFDNEDTEIERVFLEPSGNIIEGWQKLEERFTYPENASYMSVEFDPGTAGTVYYDDLRLLPSDGNMQTYVYELDTYRLRAVMDENNYASLYYYDPEGNLYLVKKETEAGIKTIQESVSYQKENRLED